MAYNALAWIETSKQESLPCSKYQAFTLRHRSASVMSFSLGTRSSASNPLLGREKTNPVAVMR